MALAAAARKEKPFYFGIFFGKKIFLLFSFPHHTPLFYLGWRLTLHSG
jgi:hypothetical protein